MNNDPLVKVRQWRKLAGKSLIRWALKKMLRDLNKFMSPARVCLRNSLMTSWIPITRDNPVLPRPLQAPLNLNPLGKLSNLRNKRTPSTIKALVIKKACQPRRSFGRRSCGSTSRSRRKGRRRVGATKRAILLPRTRMSCRGRTVSIHCVRRRRTYSSSIYL
jgi:hypothetical protein